MRAGSLRHRVILQSLSQPQNAVGEAVEEWMPQAEVWAEVRAMSGREWHEMGQAPMGANTVEVIIRHRDDVTRTMRVLHGARTLEIVAIMDRDGRGREMRLLCSEVLP